MVSGNEKSQFNDAIGFLKRLDLYFRMANLSNATNDIFNWYTNLNILYCELVNYIPEKERDKKMNELVDLKNRVDNWLSKRNSDRRNMSIPSDLYWDLFKYHLYLKKVFGDSGLENKMVDEALKALK